MLKSPALVFLLCLACHHAWSEVWVVESGPGGQNQACYSEQGAWSDFGSKSTASVCTSGIGSRSASTSYSGRTARFTLPSLAGSHAFFISITHPYSPDARTHCLITIVHDGGINYFPYDQTQNADVWMRLGLSSFACTPGTSYVEICYDTAAHAESGRFYADAVMFQQDTSVTGWENY